MKNVRLTFALLAFAGMMFLSSCGEDDDPAVTGSIAITIEGLPSGTLADITVINESNEETAVTESTELTDLTLGVYTIQIAAVDHLGSRYINAEEEVQVNVSDAAGESVTISYAESSTVNGMIGTWVSAGDDVAALLVTFFTVDSVVATFNANQTYEVLQYAGGSTTALTLSGTFSQSESSVAGIWEISVDQTSPSTLTSQGIFNVDASNNPNSAQYEIVQTSPDIGATAPTAVDGFGSSSGGAFGTTNIQTYRRRSF